MLHHARRHGFSGLCWCGKASGLTATSILDLCFLWNPGEFVKRVEVAMWVSWHVSFMMWKANSMDLDSPPFLWRCWRNRSRVWIFFHWENEFHKTQRFHFYYFTNIFGCPPYFFFFVGICRNSMRFPPLYELGQHWKYCSIEDLHRITESQLILKGFQEEVVTHCARRVVPWLEECSWSQYHRRRLEPRRK